MSDHTFGIIWVVKIFLYSSVYSCQFLLISSTSVESIPFLSFIVPILAWNIPLANPNPFSHPQRAQLLTLSTSPPTPATWHTWPHQAQLALGSGFRVFLRCLESPSPDILRLSSDLHTISGSLETDRPGCCFIAQHLTPSLRFLNGSFSAPVYILLFKSINSGCAWSLLLLGTQGSSPVAGTGFSLQWPLLCGAQALGALGFRSGGSQARWLCCVALVAPEPWDLLGSGMEVVSSHWQAQPLPPSPWGSPVIHFS